MFSHSNTYTRRKICNQSEKSYSLENYYVLNLQGDVIELRNADGTLYCSYTYDAWGKVLSVRDGDGNAITGINNIANRNPFRYRGYVYDPETKLYYCQSRYYDPQTRRFINADSRFDEGAGFTGYNLFTYCSNNPVMLYDPSGEFSIEAAIRRIVRNYLSMCNPTFTALNIYFELGSLAFTASAPIYLTNKDCPITAALIEYAMYGSGNEIHNQQQLPGYHPIMDTLVEEIKKSDYFRSLVIDLINSNSAPKDRQGEFNLDDGYDLFVGVHGFDYWVKITPKGNGVYGIHVVLWDDFDFDYSWLIEKGFSLEALANDTGLVLQTGGNLVPVHFLGKFWI